jgi:tetratricopeptide (TPR) repeat protein
MRWIYFHTLFIMAMFSLGAQDCADALEAAFEKASYEECLQIHEDCAWEDSLRLSAVVGLAAYEVQAYAQAKKYLVWAFESGDSSALVLQKLAMLMEDELNYPRAIKYKKLSVQQDSTHAQGWYQLGQLYLKAELPLEAGVAFAKAVSLKPEDYKARVKLADILVPNGQADLADSLIQAGIQQDSTNVLLQLSAGKIAYYLDSFAKAISHFDRAEQSIDLPIKYARMKGISLYRSDSFALAMRYLRNALVDTERDYIHYYMGMCFLGLEDSASAARQFELALEESYAKGIPLYCDYRANIYEQNGDYRKAIDLYEEAYRRSEDGKYLIRIANAYDRLYDDKNVAIRYFNKYLKTQQDKYRSYAEERVSILKSYEHMKQ